MTTNPNPRANALRAAAGSEPTAHPTGLPSAFAAPSTPSTIARMSGCPAGRPDSRARSAAPTNTASTPGTASMSAAFAMAARLSNCAMHSASVLPNCWYAARSSNPHRAARLVPPEPRVPCGGNRTAAAAPAAWTASSTWGTSTPAAPASSTRWIVDAPWSGTRTSGATPRPDAMTMCGYTAGNACSISITTKSKPANAMISTLSPPLDFTQVPRCSSGMLALLHRCAGGPADLVDGDLGCDLHQCERVACRVEDAEVGDHPSDDTPRGQRQRAGGYQLRGAMLVDVGAQHEHPFRARGEIHRAAHTSDQRAGDGPVGEITGDGDLHRPENGHVDPSTSDHGERQRRVEHRRPGRRRDRLLAGVDQVGVHLVRPREGPDAQDAVLAVQHDPARRRHVRGHGSGQPDTEVHIATRRQLGRGPAGDLVTVPRHRPAPGW